LRFALCSLRGDTLNVAAPTRSESFKPERFLSKDSEASKHFVAFSAGARMCVVSERVRASALSRAHRVLRAASWRGVSVCVCAFCALRFARSRTRALTRRARRRDEDACGSHRARIRFDVGIWEERRLARPVAGYADAHRRLQSSFDEASLVSREFGAMRVCAPWRGDHLKINIRNFKKFSDNLSFKAKVSEQR
jgi:hypothetical protein